MQFVCIYTTAMYDGSCGSLEKPEEDSLEDERDCDNHEVAGLDERRVFATVNRPAQTQDLAL